MNQDTSKRFARHMMEKSKFLAARYSDLSNWTDWDDRLLPIVLMGDFGIEMAENFDSIPEVEWAELVALIEDGLASPDENIGTAVATGLIEALVHVAEPVEGLWPRIDAALGPEARAYADAYRNAPFMNR